MASAPPDRTSWAILGLSNLPGSITAEKLKPLLESYSSDGHELVHDMTMHPITMGDGIKGSYYSGPAIVIMTDFSRALEAANSIHGALFMDKVISVSLWGSKPTIRYSDLQHWTARNLRPPDFTDFPSTGVSKTSSETISTFTSFGSLPAEVRLMIWKIYIEEDKCREVYTHLEWQGSRKGFISRSPTRPCLQINRESRYEALKLYQLHFDAKKVKARVRCSLQLDRFYLTCPEGESIGLHSLARLFTHAPLEQLNQIQHLAFNFNVWAASTGRFRYLEVLDDLRVKMPALRTITFVFNKGLDLDDRGSANLGNQQIGFTKFFPFSHDTNYTRKENRLLVEYVSGHVRVAKSRNPTWRPEIRFCILKRGGQHVDAEAGWGSAAWVLGTDLEGSR